MNKIQTGLEDVSTIHVTISSLCNLHWPTCFQSSRVQTCREDLQKQGKFLNKLSCSGPQNFEFPPNQNPEFIPPNCSHLLPGATCFAHKAGQRNPHYRRVVTGDSSIAIQKGINIKDRSAAHRLKLGNLRVLGMKVATAIAYW